MQRGQQLAQHIGGMVSRSVNTVGQSISWQRASRRFLCSIDFDGSLEESREGLQSSSYHTPAFTLRLGY
jgi:hypothetical protein